MRNAGFALRAAPDAPRPGAKKKRLPARAVQGGPKAGLLVPPFPAVLR
jgi:hypothetical protein